MINDSLILELIKALKKFPGVGEKSAWRYFFALLNEDEAELEHFGQLLMRLKKEVKKCPKCGYLALNGHCEFCDDEKRDFSKIMVVSYIQDVMAIEKTEVYRGLYHVLDGVISSSKGIYAEDLNIASLKKRIDSSIKEVIIATSPTIDGEMTAIYLDKILKREGLLITRLAHGLPMGASLDYADELTLIKAMDNRRKVEEENA